MTVWLFYDFVATGEPKINCPVVQIVKPSQKAPQKLISKARLAPGPV